jgi:hypothetical protein
MNKYDENILFSYPIINRKVITSVDSMTQWWLKSGRLHTGHPW